MLQWNWDERYPEYTILANSAGRTRDIDFVSTFSSCKSVVNK